MYYIPTCIDHAINNRDYNIIFNIINQMLSVNKCTYNIGSGVYDAFRFCIIIHFPRLMWVRIANYEKKKK